MLSKWFNCYNLPIDGTLIDTTNPSQSKSIMLIVSLKDVNSKNFN